MYNWTISILKLGIVQMFVRTLLPVLHRLAKQYPVITLMGPRQAGKTTLIQTAFPEKT